MSFLERLKRNVETNKFVPLNDMFSYGRTEQTVHIHIVPKDLRPLKQELGQQEFEQLLQDKLEDFLSKMQVIAKSDDTIKQLFAVSPIFYHNYMRNLFETLQFEEVKEISLESNDDEYKLKFLNMFNNGKERKNRVFYTQMSREKLLSQNYQSKKNRSEKERENI